MSAWVHAVLDLPEDEPADAPFWATVLGWPLGDPWPDHAELASFTPPDGDAYVHRRRVAGPAGVHLDVEVADLAATTERLTALGAVVVHATADRRALRSPGGLGLGLLPARRHAARPGPVRTLTGTPRRLVQVCLDIPPQHVEREAAFWRAVLPWREVEITEPEFLGRLVPPAGNPLQVLLQRLGDDDGGTATRAHLDLGSDDLAGDVRLLEGLGATRLHDGDGFVALRDPAGLPCCVTGNAPDAP